MATPAGIPGTLINTFADVQFNNSADIDTFFQDRKQQHYVPWFNATLAGQGPWANVQLVNTPANDVLFHQFWDQGSDLFGSPMSLVQFVCLMSIISNEVRGDFLPKTEKMGRTGHPGMAYLFDSIPGVKRSYNTLSGNQTALQCFNDETYIAAHGNLALADRLARTTDARWSGDVYPQADFPTDSSLAVSGFITQADFMKFRGRGYIQTTGRSNYAALIDFVQNYQGDNATVTNFQQNWADKTADQVAFETTNDDWDRLFQQTDLIIAAEAIRTHNANSGNYLALSADPAVLNGTGPGSVFFMGLRISGGQNYANTFKQRVGTVLASI